MELKIYSSEAPVAALVLESVLDAVRGWMEWQLAGAR